MNLRSFVGELKRRDVFKVAIAYAVVEWLVGFEENLALIQTIFGDWYEFVEFVSHPFE